MSVASYQLYFLVFLCLGQVAREYHSGHLFHALYYVCIMVRIMGPSKWFEHTAIRVSHSVVFHFQDYQAEFFCPPYYTMGMGGHSWQAAALPPEGQTEHEGCKLCLFSF